LYWHFLDEKKQHFATNQRMSIMLALLRKMKPEELASTKEKAISILENVDNL
jgi:deoxyribodipyrimidine photolyase-related protein